MTISVSDLIIELDAAKVGHEIDLVACNEILSIDVLTEVSRGVVQTMHDDTTTRITLLSAASTACGLLVANGYPTTVLPILTKEVTDDISACIEAQETNIDTLIGKVTDDS